jgi:hypothetical protein
MNHVTAYLRDRAAEPGTWTGLTLALVALSLVFNVDQAELARRFAEAAAVTATIRAAMKG